MFTRCSAAACGNPSTHSSSYSYVTGQNGRVSTARRTLCSGHAAAFARQHGIEYRGPEPAPIVPSKRRFELCGVCLRRTAKAERLPIDVQVLRRDPATGTMKLFPVAAGEFVHIVGHMVYALAKTVRDLGVLTGTTSLAADDHLIPVSLYDVLRAAKRTGSQINDTE